MPRIDKSKIVEADLSYKLVGISFEIQKKLGFFCREKQYADAFENELKKEKISYKREYPIMLEDKKSNFADFSIENKILIDLKAKSFIEKDDYYQMKRYLEATSTQLGLIINFRQRHLQPKRVLNSKFNSKHSNAFVVSYRDKGFSLIELLIYVSIFAVAGGMMFGVLALILKVNQRESASGEITSQLNFVSQTLSRLVRSSSNIEIDAVIATSTLKLRMKDPTKDPTCIYLDSTTGIIKLSEGPDTPSNLQNCSPVASNLTNDRIKVDKLEFTKSVQYPGHDSVSMNIQMSYNSQAPGAQATREIKSASMRFSTAEFSDNILPSNDALYDVGSSTYRWRSAAFSGNLLAAGNVGIGTTTPKEKLTILNGSIHQKPGNPVLIGGVELINDVNHVAISGRYAYIVKDYNNDGLCSITNQAYCEFLIYDVSNPSLPIFIGGENLETETHGIKISGRYAYITKRDNAGVCSITNPTYCEFLIYDVSNPSAPSFVGGVELTSRADSIFISGRYAYLSRDMDGSICSNIISTGCEFSIYDISNPTSPKFVGGADTGNDNNNYHVSISGRYAYVVNTTSTGVCSSVTSTGCEFRIYDISNPTSPKFVGGADLTTTGDVVAISGRYAYIVKWKNAEVCSIANPTYCEFLIYDVSNPSAPSFVGGTELEGDGFYISIYGRYVYIVKINNTGTCSSIVSTGCEFSIYDISNPSVPSFIGGADLGNHGFGVTISGRYAYIAKQGGGGNEFRIYDISGIETVSGMIHSLETGDLQVRNDIIAQGQLQVSGGINVGTGGIFSAGPIGVSIASTTQTNAISAYFQGRVGIGTTTPTQALEVNGGIRLNPVSEHQPSCASNTAGTLWHFQGSNDQLQICAASSTNYTWRPL